MQCACRTHLDQGAVKTLTDDHLRDLTDSFNRADKVLGSIERYMLWDEYLRRAPGDLSPIARRLRIVEQSLLIDLFYDALDEGVFTDEDVDALRFTDLVLIGQHRGDGRDIYVLVELAPEIGPMHVERAIMRARLLEELGRHVVPVVGGDKTSEDVMRLASDRGVWCVVDRHAITPRGT